MYQFFVSDDESSQHSIVGKDLQKLEQFGMLAFLLLQQLQRTLQRRRKLLLVLAVFLIVLLGLLPFCSYLALFRLECAIRPQHVLAL